MNANLLSITGAAGSSETKIKLAPANRVAVVH